MVKEISERLILHWNYRGYYSLPEELCICGNHVCELYLKYNNITELPNWIENMTNLTNIYLQANYLTELPEAIQFLTSLTTLDVSQNHLTTIPSSIGKLVNLKTLVLTQNQLACLPSSLGSLPCLVSLLVSSNKLTELPESLHQCQNLEQIHLDFNQFTSLPNFLTRLSRLKRLSVCSNQLTHLPHLPFACIERFLCDNNPCISYLPYPLACQMNRPPAQPLATRNVLHISTLFGCFNPSNRKEATVLVKDSPSAALCFLPDIDLICTYAPPSLLELTLRSISSRIFNEPLNINFDRKQNLHRFESSYHHSYDQRIGEFCLPSTLIQLLRDGPVAICLGCRTFIFRGPAYPVFLSKIIVQYERAGHDLMPVVCSLLFCSASCFRTATAVGAMAGLENPLDWECMTRRTTSTN
ncbi:putative Leucine-rich repeat-containing protein 28 [Daphnia magna]|uniref:Putative Leucine-rich repeat-containing protein 28 n=1 Tax=Daphnia magna TaxID=35525 RepID=A0A162N9A9_9CRUS|nr:putative Leucine-rich repeat-containing protein 28 [Daphnia magna]